MVLMLENLMGLTMVYKMERKKVLMLESLMGLMMVH
jgi:hypothetical protein